MKKIIVIILAIVLVIVFVKKSNLRDEKGPMEFESIEEELSVKDIYDILNSEEMNRLFEIEISEQEQLEGKRKYNSTFDMVSVEYEGELFPENLIMECQKVLYEVFEKEADICYKDNAYFRWLNTWGAEDYILSLEDMSELFEDFERDNVADIYEAYELISGLENCTNIFWIERESGEDKFVLCEDSGGSYGLYNIYLAELIDEQLVVHECFEAQGEGLGRVIKYGQYYYYIYLRYNQNLKIYDGIKIHKLEQDAEHENIIIRYIPKEYVVENLLISHNSTNKKIELYIKEIMDDLLTNEYLEMGRDDAWDYFIGDEVAEEQFPLESEYEKYVKADIANTGADVYFQKKIFIPSNSAFSAYYKTDFYLWDETNEEVLKIDELNINGMSQNQLVQLWFKEFDELTYTFRVFHLENYEYVFDVSIVERNEITLLRRDLLLPLCSFELTERCVESY